MMEKREKVVSSIANIYKLDGRVPLSKAIPFGSTTYSCYVRS